MGVAVGLLVGRDALKAPRVHVIVFVGQLARCPSFETFLEILQQLGLVLVENDPSRRVLRLHIDDPVVDAGAPDTLAHELADVDELDAFRGVQLHAVVADLEIRRLACVGEA